MSLTTKLDARERIKGVLGFRGGVCIEYKFNSSFIMVGIRFSKLIFLAVALAVTTFAAPAPASSSAADSGSGTGSSHIPSSALSPSSVASAPESSPTVPYASNDPNEVLWGPDTPDIPQAIRGSLGASVLGPQDIGMVKENADFLAPPSTDSGSVYVSFISLQIQILKFTRQNSPNAKWPMSLSHNRLQTGGWARQQNGVCGCLFGMFIDSDLAHSWCHADCNWYVVHVAWVRESNSIRRLAMAGVNMRLEAGAVR